MSDRADFVSLIEPVARHFWGEPNPKASKKNELRWGTHGARSIVLDKGTFFDNEAGKGGGVLDLVARETGLAGGEAVQWLKDNGFAVPDDGRRHSNGAAQPRSEPEKKDGPARIVATYDYKDEEGKLLYQIVRMEPKTFRQRRPDKDARGGWEWKKGARQIPYRLEDVIDAVESREKIFVVEGEKDVDSLKALGITATCNAGGAGKWPVDFKQFFGDADVIILPDNDDAGRGHANLVGASIRDAAKSVRVLDLPGLEEKGDVSDWIEAGGTAEILFDLVERRARPWSAEIPSTTFGALRWEDLDNPGEEVEFIIDDWFTAGDMSLIAGPSKSGKSFLAVDGGGKVALASVWDKLPAEAKDKLGEGFFGHKIMTGGLVIYQAGEGGRGVKQRFRAFRKHFGIPKSLHLPFVLLTKKLDLYRGGERSDTDRLIAEVKAWQAYYDVPLKMVIVDTLAQASPGADENSAKDVTQIAANCNRIKEETGAHVCLVHHMNAGGTKVRGHSSIYAGMDQVVLVTKDPLTAMRTALLDKQKDAEDGKVVHFELKSIEVGIRAKDGKSITSCVCVDVGVKDQRRLSEIRKAFKASEEEKKLVASIIAATRKKGVPVPVGVKAPPSVAFCCNYADLLEDFAPKLWTGEEDDEAAHKARVRKALSRAGKVLSRANVIGKHDKFLWWTGRAVVGLNETFPRDEEPPPSTGSLMTADDVDEFR